MAGNVFQAVMQAIGEAGKGTSKSFSNAADVGSGRKEASDIDWSSTNGGHTAVGGAVKGYTNGAIDTTPEGTDSGGSMDFGSMVDAFKGGGKGGAKIGGGGTGGGMSGAMSDERLKDMQWDRNWTRAKELHNCGIADVKSNPILDAFNSLDAIMFSYNNTAQQLDDTTGSIDQDMHTGIKAQDLEKTPAFQSAVQTEPNGYKSIDTKEMTLANSAGLSEVVKKLQEVIEHLNALEQGK